VNRRYREFNTLHKALQKDAILATALPRLPSKKIFGSSLDPQFVQERRTQLQVRVVAQGRGPIPNYMTESRGRELIRTHTLYTLLRMTTWPSGSSPT
jgi:hypothetical protein